MSFKDPCVICDRWREGACMDCTLDDDTPIDHPCVTCDKPLDDCDQCPVENKLFNLKPEESGSTHAFGVYPCTDCKGWPKQCSTCADYADYLASGGLRSKGFTYNYGTGYQGYTGKYGTTYVYQRCGHGDWFTFKDKNDKEVSLFLGSSGVTVPAEVDVYIRLTTNEPDEPYVPKWLKKYLPKAEKDEYLVNWYVADGSPGSDELVTFALNILEAGLTLGFGCVGGHGRTGWLACRIMKALTNMSGDQAVRFLRKEYCEKAVESLSQAQNLGMVEETPYYHSSTVATKIK